MLSFISKILSQHVAFLVTTRISPCSALPKCCIHSHSGLSTLLHIGLSQHVVFLVATRISPCFALSKCCIHSHSGLSALLHIGLSQHAFLRAPHSRNAAYIRIPGYRRFSTLVCRNTHFSVLRTPEMLHTFAFRAIGASPHWFVATRISPCSALPKCCIHSHSGLSPYLLMYVCSVNRQSTLPASSHVPCDYRTIATSSSRGMCKLHPYAR